MSAIEIAIAVFGVTGLSQLAILTGIFFRLGRGAARMEELFRRVIRLEEKHLDGAS